MKRVGFLLLVCVLTASAYAADTTARTTYYVQVIWGTDQPKPSGTDYREIGPKLGAKLSPVFRWKHYWETERRKVQLEPAKVTRLPLAQQRSVEIERLKSGDIEVRLYRRSGLVTKTRQSCNDRMAILGGEDSQRDSFFVVVRPDEPLKVE
jgi:hypothetical protein